MFEYFVRPHICLSVSPSKHFTPKILLVWMGHSISSWVLGGRDMGLSLDLCLGWVGEVFFF